MVTGQLFSRTTQALFYNYKQSPVQRMLDFDFLCGRELPSVAGVIQPGSEGFQKLFFGQSEIAVPVHGSIAAACKAHATADVFINFASFRSAFASSMEALLQPTIRVVAIIAEGVPEGDAKKLIAYARSNNKVLACSPLHETVQLSLSSFIHLLLPFLSVFASIGKKMRREHV